MAQKVVAIKQDTDTLACFGSVNPNISLIRDNAEGNIYEEFAAIGQHAPVARVTFRDVESALSWVGPSGAAIAGSTVELYQKDYVQGGHGDDGEMISLTDGVIVPETLTLTDGQPANISYAIFAGGSDTAPYSETSDATPPSVSVSNRWEQGPVTYNGVTIEKAMNSQINFGWTPQQTHGSGAVWPSLVYLEKPQPTIETTVMDEGAVSEVTLQGSNNALEITILKLQDGGARAGSGDLTISCSKQLVTVNSIDGQRNQPTETTLSCAPTSSDGVTYPITISS